MPCKMCPPTPENPIPEIQCGTDPCGSGGGHPDWKHRGKVCWDVLARPIFSYDSSGNLNLDANGDPKVEIEVKLVWSPCPWPRIRIDFDPRDHPSLQGLPSDSRAVAEDVIRTVLGVSTPDR